MRFFVVSAIFYSLTMLQAATAGIDFASIMERFGFPVAFCLLLWFFFSKQNEKRHKEQTEFWADNNKYLRELVDKQSHCKFEK